MGIHLAFDILAALGAMALTALTYRWRPRGLRLPDLVAVGAMATDARRLRGHHVTGTPPSASPPLAPIRTFLVVIGVLLMLFAGGCSVYFLWILVPNYAAGTWLLVALYGGVPFALAFLATRLALRLGRRPTP